MIVKLQWPDGLTAATFMRDFWQQRPLLMRAALDPALFSLEPGDLAGLACEDNVESRLVVGSGQRWNIRHGPFNEADFGGLTAPHWTPLVQDVDKLVDDVADIIDLFDFVPTWRIDDIMVSYASDGGGVGPHTDAYDVFLMQGLGKRRWQLSDGTYGEHDLLPGLEQRILREFDASEDWVLGPGDVLYLPPGVAHWGTAEGACMTYSLGFRAPSQRELAADWCQWLVEQADDSRLADPEDAGGSQISIALQRQAASVINDLPGTDSDAFRRWLGEYFTSSKPQFELTPVEEMSRENFMTQLDQCIAADAGLRRHPFARLAWSLSSQGELWLFCQGQCLTFNDAKPESAQTICARRVLGPETLDELRANDSGVTAVLHALFCQGALETMNGDEL